MFDDHCLDEVLIVWRLLSPYLVSSSYHFSVSLDTKDASYNFVFSKKNLRKENNWRVARL